LRREIDLGFSAAEVAGACFERAASYICSDALVARLIEKRDENPTAVDYDLDTDDEEMLEQANRRSGFQDGGSTQEQALAVEELEAAMNALEVASFDVMMQQVEVPACPTYVDSSQPGIFTALLHHSQAIPSQGASPVSGPSTPVDYTKGKHAIKEHALGDIAGTPQPGARQPAPAALPRVNAAGELLGMPGKGGGGRGKDEDEELHGLPDALCHKRFSFLLGNEVAFTWVPAGVGSGGARCGRRGAGAACDGAAAAPAADRHAVVKRSPPRQMNEAEELGVCAVCLNDGAEQVCVCVCVCVCVRACVCVCARALARLCVVAWLGI